MVPGSLTTERYPGAGRMAPSLVIDQDSGEVVGQTEPRATDLVVGRVREVVTVTAGDGRQLVARFDLDADEPLIPEGADADLVYALRRAWRRRPPIGRPPAIMNIESDEQVGQAVALTRSKHLRLTARNVGTWSETFTYANLRSYLRVTRRTWHELLDTLLAPERPSTTRSSGRGPDSTSPRKF